MNATEQSKHKAPLPGTTLITNLRHEGEVARFFDLEAVSRLPGKHLRKFGACWTPQGYLLATDLAADAVWFWQPGGLPKVFRRPAGGPTWMKLDPLGRLLVLENLCNTVTRTEPDGGVIAIVDLEKLGNNVEVTDIAGDLEENLYIATRTETVAGFGSQKVGTIQRYAEHKKREDIGIEASLPVALDWDQTRESLWVVNGPDGAVWEVHRVSSSEAGYRWESRQVCSLWNNGDIDLAGIAVRADGLIAVTSDEGLFLVDSDGRKYGVVHLPEPAFRASWGGPWSERDLIVAAGVSVYFLPGTDASVGSEAS